MGPFSHITGFDWDGWNLDKNWEKHQVANAECEEVFFNTPLVVRPDPGHSGVEPRYFALGMTDQSRPLFVVFTIRRDKVRVISAREMTDRELEVYRDCLRKSAKIQE